MNDYDKDEGLMCPKCGAPEHRIKMTDVDFCVNHYQCGYVIGGLWISVYEVHPINGGD